MLSIITTVTSTVLLLLTVLQSIYVLRYRNILNTELRAWNGTNSGATAGTNGPPVALILCLRGVDPTLSQCLAGIVNQDHPNFQLHLVFDHLQDPAVEYVRKYFDGTAIRPVTHFNNAPLETCTLKCSGLITVLSSLPAGTEFIALIDADTVADKSWLIDLLAPFADPNIGATTGNRWFTPRETNIGTVFRKVWNAAAVPQVVLYNIGWGGTLAFRHRTLKEAEFTESLATAFCEDTMVSEKLASVNMKMYRVPSLIMENTESTTLGDALRWIARQTLTVRLHHRMWPFVLGHGALTAIACYGSPVLILIALTLGRQEAAIILTCCFLLYQIINFVLLGTIDQCNRKMITSRRAGESTGTDRSSFFGNVLAAVLNQYLFPLAVYRAWKMKSVHWRGIEYLIDANNGLRMKAFVPYRDVIDAESHGAKDRTSESIQ